MREIIYQSIADPSLTGEDVFRLVYRSRMANGDAGLSGFLIFSHGRFLQLLEGESDRLDRAFSAIRQDPRHGSVEVLSDRAIASPLFDKWSMRRIPAGDAESARDHICTLLPGAMPVSIDNALVRFFDSIAAQRAGGLRRSA